MERMKDAKDELVFDDDVLILRDVARGKHKCKGQWLHLHNKEKGKGVVQEEDADELSQDEGEEEYNSSLITAIPLSAISLSQFEVGCSVPLAGINYCGEATPCNLTTLLHNIKLFDLGRPMMNSIEISFHTCFGIGKGYNKPLGDVPYNSAFEKCHKISQTP
ncbi:hypothetical protein CR513_08889, partial [Mucuna pruriens]